MKYKSLLFSCLLGTAGFLSTQAVAGGSIGGDCCADLEERVAELEATTVRKGNRKVTLTVSGNVNRALMWSDEVYLTNFDETLGGYKKYDDGLKITDSDAPATTIRLYGLGAVTRDIYVGYRLDFTVQAGGTKAGGYSYNDGPVTMIHNELLLGSRTYGNLYIGMGYTASDFAAEQDLSGTNYYAGGSVAHANSVGNLDGFGRRERIRYESPAIAGFKVSASWQENGNWDAAVNYKGALGDFDVVGAVAYYELGTARAGVWGGYEDIPPPDFDFVATNSLNTSQKGDGGVTGSISALHKPTGLSLTFAAGEVDNIGVTHEWNLTKNFWYLKAGFQRKLLGAGKTYFSVDYMNQTNANVADYMTFFGQSVKDTEVERWGVQLVQDVDAAAMKVYASYWNQSSDALATDLFNYNEEAVMVGINIDF